MHSFTKLINYNIDAFREFSCSSQTPIKVNVPYFYLINPNALIILIMGGEGHINLYTCIIIGNHSIKVWEPLSKHIILEKLLQIVSYFYLCCRHHCWAVF
jgi:hypothetical protein